MKRAFRESPLKRIQSAAFDCAQGRSSCVMNEKEHLRDVKFAFHIEPISK